MAVRPKIDLPLLLFAGLLAAAPGAAEDAGASGKPTLKSKMAWVWTLGKKPVAEVVKTARALGFNAIQARNREMVETARSTGASAKFAGSGGAIIGTYEDEGVFKALRERLCALGCEVFKPEII